MHLHQESCPGPSQPASWGRCPGFSQVFLRHRRVSHPLSHTPFPSAGWGAAENTEGRGSEGSPASLPVTTATLTLRPCSQQEILEEVVRELHRVKDEIIDGEWQGPPTPTPSTGRRPARLTPRVLGEGSGACAQGCKPGARRAQPVRPFWARRLRVCAEGFRSSSPQPTPASQFSGWAD